MKIIVAEENFKGAQGKKEKKKAQRASFGRPI